MTVVRRQCINLRAVRVERDREVLAVFDPEVAVEAPLQVGCFLFEPIGELGILPDVAREGRPAHFGVVRVTLELAGRAREPRQRTITIRDRVPGVLPTLVLET